MMLIAQAHELLIAKVKPGWQHVGVLQNSQSLPYIATNLFWAIKNAHTDDEDDREIVWWSHDTAIYTEWTCFGVKNGYVSDQTSPAYTTATYPLIISSTGCDLLHITL